MYDVFISHATEDKPSIADELSAEDIARHAPTLSGKAFASTAEGLPTVCDKICKAVSGSDPDTTQPAVRVLSRDLRKSLLRTRQVVEFEVGFRHVLVYEREAIWERSKSAAWWCCGSRR